jgi:precorrin-6B methylase 2
MNFIWNVNTIRWYQNANQYTGFFERLADLIAPMLTPSTSFCDIGCGLGLIDLALSNRVRAITCIDINAIALAALKDAIKNRGITNITPRQMSGDDVCDQWEVILTSFFGSRDPQQFLPYCQKQIAVVVNKESRGASLEHFKTFHQNSVQQVVSDLSQKKIPYSLTEVTLDFGQPLASLDDGVCFLNHHYPKMPSSEISQYLDAQLIETGDSVFPYYLPKKKALGIFEIEGRGR